MDLACRSRPNNIYQSMNKYTKEYKMCLYTCMNGASIEGGVHEASSNLCTYLTVTNLQQKPSIVYATLCDMCLLYERGQKQ
jgi:hypothetical protein